VYFTVLSFCVVENYTPFINLFSAET